MSASPQIAYLSMEIALTPEIPTHSGGLAGAFLSSAADLQTPTIGLTLLHRQGYFRQRLDAAGHQKEEPSPWIVSRHVRELPARLKKIAAKASSLQIVYAGEAHPADHDRAHDAGSLHDQLERKVLPLCRRNHGAFTEAMRHCIAFNGSFFNTHRMLGQYAQRAYRG